MDLIVKKASALTTEELTSMGILGIPGNWPIESYPYVDTIPVNFELMTDIEMEALKANNQAAYDAWLAVMKVQTVQSNTQLVELASPADLDKRPQFRQVISRPEFHYSPRSLDFYTAKYGSLYNRSHFGDGTIDGAPDLGDATLKFYDADNVELVRGAEESLVDYQIRLVASCTKTVMRFEPTFSYDVIGAKLQFRNIPSDRAYFWFVAAPDVPVEGGGNVVFMGGGMNISFFNEKDTFTCDGKTVSAILHDGTYHSGAVALMVKHNVGVQIGIQLIYQFYS